LNEDHGIDDSDDATPVPHPTLHGKPSAQFPVSPPLPKIDNFSHRGEQYSRLRGPMKAVAVGTGA
jgi:hypothetical protein